MQYNWRPVPETHTESQTAGDTGESEYVFLPTDPNFTRVANILNKCLPNNDSSSCLIMDDLNQNKAIGPLSELNTYTQGFTAVTADIKDDSNRIESELRGGSTFSDLHNTEYIEEAGPFAKLIKSDRYTPIKQQTPKNNTKSFIGEHHADEKFSNGTRQENRLSGMQSRGSIDHLGLGLERGSGIAQNGRHSSHGSLPKSPAPYHQGHQRQKRSESAQRPLLSTKFGLSSEIAQNEETTTSTEQDTEDSSLPSPVTTTSQEKISKPGSLKITIENSVGGRVSDNFSYSRSLISDLQTVGTSHITTDMPHMTPDPTASRDLDNASPKTIELCQQHQFHYCFFVYFSSATVDEDLLPFRRKAFMERVEQLENPEQMREIKDTRCARDAFSDRRIRSIERQSGTEIRLGDLHPDIGFIKGLPRRRLTIAGPSFGNICCALNLFEHLLPSVVKAGIFPYRLPTGASTRFSSGKRHSSAHNWSYGRSDGTTALIKQIDDKGGWRYNLPVAHVERVGNTQ